jgi:hypothetical protein
VAGLAVYQWDGEKWTAGPPALPDGLVHYDITQSLTNAQKTTARTNIGVLVNTANSSDVDFNTLTATGSYYAFSFTNAPMASGNKDWYVEVFQYGNPAYVYQRAIDVTTSGTQAEFERRCINGVWEAWTRLVRDTAVTGAWTAFTPTIAPFGGAFTSASATGRYKLIGEKTVAMAMNISVTNIGTASGPILITQPFTAGPQAYYLLYARELNVNGFSGTAAIASGQVQMSLYRYDNGAMYVNGCNIAVDGVFERA